MEHDLDLIRRGAVWVLFAFAVFATAMHAWLRLKAVGAEGMQEGTDTHAKDGGFTRPEARKFARNARIWRVTAMGSAVAAIALTALGRG